MFPFNPSCYMSFKRNTNLNITHDSQTVDTISHSMPPEMVPILGNDAKTQGKPSDFAKSRHDRQPSLSKKINKSSRRPHLILKRAKVSGGPGMSLKRIPKRSELVFLQPSPNYCEPDLAQGSLGTQGRYCNRTSKGKEIRITKIRVICISLSVYI